jgi:hypothetical protein
LPTAQITPAGPTRFCSGGSVVLNATTGTGYTYQWKLNNINLSGAISSSYTALQAGNYTVTVTSNTCPVTSSIVSVQIGSPITATISASGATTFCNGNSVLLSANTGSGLNYEWKKDGIDISGATSSTYSATTSGSYTAVVYNNGCPSTSNAINVNVTSPFTVNVTTVGSNKICPGGSVLLQGDQVSGYYYQWRLNGDTISGANQYQYAAFQPGLYSLTVTYNGCIVTSSSVSVTTALPSLQVTPSANQAICQGDSVVLQAPNVDGYTYQWLKNGTSIPGATSYSYTVKAIGSYSVTLTSSPCAGTSNVVVVNVSSLNAPIISIGVTSGSNPTCIGNAITFTATVTNGGATPVYQWKVNGVNTGTNSNTFTSSSLTNGSIVSCALSSNDKCLVSPNAVSNNITIIVNSPTNNAVSQTACNSYVWFGNTYSLSGVYTRAYTNVNGCNSVDTLRLKINQSTSSTQSLTICSNQLPYLWNGVTFTAAGAQTAYITNAAGCDSAITLNLSVNSCFTTLNVKVFLEGFYKGNGSMAPTLSDLEIINDITATDSVQVNLWSAGSLSNASPDYNAKVILHTDGTASVQFPGATLGNSYYVSIKHRNSIETWSAAPILISSNTSYDFSSDLEQAYGDGFNAPMKLMGNGVFAIYSGDVNQDGGIDIFDMQITENDAAQSAFGYYNSDCNGDGSSDIFDMQIIENNVGLSLFYSRPF